MANIKAEPPPKPDTFNGDLGKLPPALAHLKDKKIWVCWCWYWNGKKWTKPPRRVDDLGRNASSSDPTTWGSHAQAVKQVNAGKADGIGVALQGCDVGGVDLDHCCDVETSEEIAAWAEDIVNNPAPTLQWIDMSNWDNEPVPEREWAILNRVPLRQVGLVSGEGGAGKSIIELTKNVAHVTGRDWFGSIPAVGPAIYVGAEDDETEIHIRLAAIAKHYGVTFKELIDGGLHPLCLLGQDATLCAATGKGGKVEVTGLYRQLYEAAGDIKPKNISIDTLSRAFAGSEIDRVQVYAFAMHMQALALVAGGSVTVLSHPSLQGIASGSGLSGSTAWQGAFRFRQYLKGVKPDGGEQPDNNLRELQFKKNQYGPMGETIVLQYRHGLFLPVEGVTSLDQAARDAKADDVFLDLLARFTKQNRYVCDKTGTSYAPSLFAKEDVARESGLTSHNLAGAMRRLFASGKIWNEPHGKPSRPQYRIAIK
jgi:RecA-family ATPase